VKPSSGSTPAGTKRLSNMLEISEDCAAPKSNELLEEAKIGLNLRTLTATKRNELRDLGFDEDGYDYTKHLRIINESSDRSTLICEHQYRNAVKLTSQNCLELNGLELRGGISSEDFDELVAKINEIEFAGLNEGVEQSNEIGDDFFVEAMKETTSELFMYEKNGGADKQFVGEKNLENSKKYCMNTEGTRKYSLDSSQATANFDHIFALHAKEKSKNDRIAHQTVQEESNSSPTIANLEKFEILQNKGLRNSEYNVTEHSYFNAPRNDCNLILSHEQKVKDRIELNHLLHKRAEAAEKNRELKRSHIPEFILDELNISSSKLRCEIREKESEFRDKLITEFDLCTDEVQNEIWRTDITRKGETLQEKKMRKNNVKVGRRQARAGKKQLKDAFKSAKLKK
jgi:hypothetical protein